MTALDGIKLNQCEIRNDLLRKHASHRRPGKSATPQQPCLFPWPYSDSQSRGAPLHRRCQNAIHLCPPKTYLLRTASGCRSTPRTACTIPRHGRRCPPAPGHSRDWTHCRRSGRGPAILVCPGRGGSRIEILEISCYDNILLGPLNI